MIFLIQLIMVLGPTAFFVMRAFRHFKLEGGVPTFEKGFGTSIVSAMVAFVLIGVLVNSFVVIPAGTRGVVFSQTAGVEKRILPEGLSLMIPVVESVEVYNVQRSTVDIELGKGNAAASSDVQDVFVTVRITYRPKPNLVNTIWQEVGDRESLETRILTPEAVQVLKSVIPRFAAADIVTKREDIRTATLQALNERDSVDRYMEIFSVSLANVEFQPEFRALLEQKAQKTQELEIAKRNVEIAQQAKLQLITEASAAAESRKIRADGEAHQNRVLAGSVTPRSLDSRKIDVLATLAGRWQGTFPTTWTNIGGDGAPLPLLNIDALMRGATGQ